MTQDSNSSAYEGTDLKEAVQEAARAAWGDSNDDEMEALRGALDEALTLLGCTFEGLAGDALFGADGDEDES